MRMMVRIALPVEKGNAAYLDGSLFKTIDAVVDKVKPEAAYFGSIDGRRGGFMIFDMADPSQIIEISELLFLNLNAEVQYCPVMNADDLRRGVAASQGSAEEVTVSGTVTEAIAEATVEAAATAEPA